MIIVNPPWTLVDTAKDFLPILTNLLGEKEKQAHFQIRWITPE